MLTDKRPWLLTFGIAFVLTVLALVLTMTTPLKTASPFLLFIVAIVVITRLGGRAPVCLRRCLPSGQAFTFSSADRCFWHREFGFDRTLY